MFTRKSKRTSKWNSAGKHTKTVQRKLGMEAVEARQLMAADVMNAVDSIGPVPTEETAVANVSQIENVTDVDSSANHATAGARISNGFLKNVLAEGNLNENASKIDIWEHIYANMSQNKATTIEADRGDAPTTSIGSSGLDGFTADHVDDVFLAYHGEDDSDGLARSSSSLPDSVLGVLRWENLMEYFQVLDQLGEIAAKYDFDFDLDGSIERARVDSGLADVDVITTADAIEIVDRVTEDVATPPDSDSSTDSSQRSKFEEMLQEAMEEFRKRLVVYWQTVNGPGAVIFDPYGVANDR